MRAAQRLGFLRKACRVLNISGRLTAYKGFVRPLMEYSPLAWGGAAPPPPHYLSQLDKMQRRALALIGPGVLALPTAGTSDCWHFRLHFTYYRECWHFAEPLAPPASSTNWCVDRVCLTCRSRHHCFLGQHMTHCQGPESKSGSQMATAFSFL